MGARFEIPDDTTIHQGRRFGVRDLVRALIASISRRRSSGSAKPGVARSVVERIVSDARLAIRLGWDDEVEPRLSAIAQGDPNQAEVLNLLGVIAERRQDWKQARRFYGKSLRADRRYAPAQQNMRRWFELATFGFSREPVALGDERPALGALLRHVEQLDACPSEAPSLQ
jgi:hypothetical protein